MIVSVSLFNTYRNNYDNTADVVELKKIIIESAESKVIEYLGFNPISMTLTERYSGTGSNAIFLDRKNITNIASVVVDGVEVNGIGFDDSKVYTTDASPSFSKGIDNILVTYTSGWTEEEMPSAIKTAILRIASLMWEETNGNIGVTSKSYGDNSRTFVKLTDYREYLKQISEYKVMRF